MECTSLFLTVGVEVTTPWPYLSTPRDEFRHTEYVSRHVETSVPAIQTNRPDEIKGRTVVGGVKKETSKTVIRLFGNLFIACRTVHRQRT